MKSWRRDWQERLFANPHLCAEDKLVLWALFRLSGRMRGHHDQEWMRLHLLEVTTQVGLAPQRVQQGIFALATAGVIRLTRLPADPEAGRLREWVFLAFTDLFDTPERITFTACPQHHEQ